MSAPQAGKAHNMAKGWIWATGSEPDGISATIRADSIIMVDPQWDKDRDICLGCEIHLSNGRVFWTSAMPHEVEDAIKDAI